MEGGAALRPTHRREIAPFARGLPRGQCAFPLGHEAPGVVGQVGPDVTDVDAGDFVTFDWRTACSRPTGPS
ncbi:alcohol dehydrogenase catalytic domain-containing protein [Streptomyces sp. NPDC058625]|uniref:alcohol dehydrogenase catalytic domain-containing protein n=1 Tax=Streptomyces sp. NPDC058625 TaxID=3346564 RepID=UPI0036620DCF